MSHELAADILISCMPWALGAKMVSFVIVCFLLWRQNASSRLAVAINFFFIFLVLNAIWVTWLGTYLTRNAEGEDIHTLNQWVLLLGLNIFPIIVSVLGFVVVELNQGSTIVSREREQDLREAEQNQREVRQNKREARS